MFSFKLHIPCDSPFCCVLDAGRGGKLFRQYLVFFTQNVGFERGSLRFPGHGA